MHELRICHCLGRPIKNGYNFFQELNNTVR